jgi:hypothetical protein
LSPYYWSNKVTSPLRHLSFEKLVDLVEEHLTQAQQEHALAHIAMCARCAEEYRQLERLVDLMRTDSAEEPAPAVVEDVLRLFRPRQAEVPPTLAQRIRAVLQFDTAQRPLALGLRSGQPAARQLLYSAGSFDLDLRLSPAGDLWLLSGQILGPEEGGNVSLHGPTGSQQIRLNELNEFELSPVASGRYTLQVRLPGAELEVPDLEIG